MQRAQDGWTENGTLMQRAIGLATLPIDRFVSLGTTGGGELTTVPFTFVDGVRINADVQGSIRATILDESGESISGFSAAESVPFSGDSIDHPLRSQGAESGQLSGRLVRFGLSIDRGGIFAVHLEG